MLLEKLHFTVNDELDFVHIKMGNINVRLGYRIAFEIAQGLINIAAEVARFDKVSIKNFKDEYDKADLEDCPRPHRRFRQSRIVPTAESWEAYGAPPLVGLLFDGKGQEMDVETTAALAGGLRRAARRAKAWAGDSSSHSNCTGILTDAEEDYRLGVA